MKAISPAALSWSLSCLPTSRNRFFSVTTSQLKYIVMEEKEGRGGGGRTLGGFSVASNASEMRRRRLAALNNIFSAGTATTADGCNDNTKHSSRKRAAPNQHPAPHGTKSSDVIDLCRDNDDDDDGDLSEARNMPEPCLTSQEKGRDSTFRVATWNIWFGPQQDGNPHPSRRMRAIVDELMEACPLSLWFMGFQEVVEPLRTAMVPLLEAAGYQVFDQPDVLYGCSLAVYQGQKKETSSNNYPTILDAGWQPYQETIMSRGFLYVRARLPGSDQQVLFTTTHLESWCGKEYTGAAQRPRQLKQLQSFCKEQMKLHKNLQIAIMTGDMNWDDERRNALDPNMLNEVLSPDWKDAWIEAKNGDAGSRSSNKKSDANKGYTYDGKLNPMLSNNLRRRFDRCLVLFSQNDNNKKKAAPGTGTSGAVADATLVGMSALPGLTWPKYNPWKQTSKQTPTAPSDHFGLIVTLK